MSSPKKETSTNNENLKVLAEACDVNTVLSTIAMRWKMQILYCIAEGVYQFSKIKKAFPSLSDQVLGKRINELQQEGLIIRTEIPDTVPQQIKYTVTDKGTELLAIILNLHQWGKKWHAPGTTSYCQLPKDFFEKP